MPAGERYAFGDFVLERSQRRVLRGDGTALDLTPRLFDALLLFVERAGDLLDKDTLMRVLWRGVVVEENSLSQVVSGLRRALGDDPQQSRYIRTIPRRGFRFVAAVTVLPGGDATAPAEPRAAERDVPESSRRRHWLRGAAAAGVAAGLGIGWWAWREEAGDGAPAPGATLAVLPFRPLNAEGRDELLELGMADSIAARLSSVPGLVVRSSSSVMRYSGSAQDPKRAARDLDVGYVVDGTLQRRGDQLRVTARLLRAADGAAVWTGSFDETIASVFDVQDQISLRVLSALAPMLQSLAAGNAQQSEPGGTRSPDAYQLYLAAAWRSQDMRSDSNAKAIDLCRQALAIDPNYAHAWALLAWVHRRRLWRVDAPPADVFDAQGEAVRRALALVPELARARAGLGFSLHMYAYDWPGAEREYRRAIAANANEDSAHFGLGMLLVALGRLDDGFAHLRLARELDPMSPVFHAVEASLLVERGRFREARARLDRALDIAPDHGLAHLSLGILHMAEHRTDDATAALRRAVELHDAATRPRAVLAMHLAAIGDADEARAILDALRARARSRYVPPTSLATACAALGETGAALDALEQGFRVRDNRMIWFKDDPSWIPLRKEPRYLALLKRLDLERYGPGLSAV